MLSTLFEVAGMVALAAASWVAGGVLPLLLVLGVELLVIGFVLEGSRVRRRVRKPGR